MTKPAEEPKTEQEQEEPAAEQDEARAAFRTGVPEFVARADAEPDEAPSTGQDEEPAAEEDEEPAAEEDEFRFSVVTRRAGSMCGAMIATVVSAALAGTLILWRSKRRAAKRGAQEARAVSAATVDVRAERRLNDE